MMIMIDYAYCTKEVTTMKYTKTRAQTFQVYHHIWQFFPSYCRIVGIPKCTMVSQQQKAECVFSFHESKSVTTVQNWLLTEFIRKPPLKQSNRHHMITLWQKAAFGEVRTPGIHQQVNKQ